MTDKKKGRPNEGSPKDNFDRDHRPPAVTEAAATFGNNFIVFFNTGTNAGNVTLNLRTGQQSPLLAGPINNAANGSDYYLLDLGFSFNDAEAFAVGMGGHLRHAFRKTLLPGINIFS